MNKAALTLACLLTLLWLGIGIWLSPVPCAAAEWPLPSLPSQGMMSNKLENLWNDLNLRHTTAFLVIQNDRVLFERYAAGYSRTKPHFTASLAKALVGGTSLTVAMNDGLMKPDDSASKYIPQWAADPLKKKITIRHLATHTSGIEDAEQDNLPHEKLSGWKGDFWKRLSPPHDPFSISRDHAPVLEEPGTRARYSNPGMAMLAYCLTVSLRGTTNIELRSLLKDRILDPIGVPAAEWSVGYGAPTILDGLPLIATWGGGSYSPNAVAHVGRLMMRRGDWDGHQLLAAEVVEMAASHAGMPNDSGLGWWVNRRPDGTRRWPSAPPDAFWGAGAGHQFLLVVPSLKLIVVRNGELLEKSADFHEALEKHLVAPLMAALVETPSNPRPASRPIKRVEWAPKETIIRAAKGSDNWPLTWGDDDVLYAAYGDGNGFEPFVPKKLSLGFAKILGEPPKIAGKNLRTPSGEQLGDGPRGRKASGMLMIDGVLYLLARNAGNSQLAWSSDHGARWTWSDWKFTGSFGCPAFLNFGRNYAGARDEFVYIYSPDSSSAYKCADRMVLARVQRAKLKEREAFSFFQNLDSAGHPIWTTDAEQRGKVLSNPGRCYRSSASYNAALRRYLLVMTSPTPRSGDAHGQIDTRFAGGLHIYDSPEPWGPWTTVFAAESWDTGPGDTASFPTKWMNADGKEAWLVFSGEDSFSMRKATFEDEGK